MARYPSGSRSFPFEIRRTRRLLGSGGCNAALMAELVGDRGTVTTIDIDGDVTARARKLLDENGYERVNVLTGDAEDGVPEAGVLDRLIVTVGAWDIPPAWTGQLNDGGRLVVPLRMRGLSRSVAFDRDGDRLVSQSAEMCGFVTMQGAGEHQERLLLLQGKEIALRFDEGWPQDPDALNGVFDTERAEVWSGVTVALTEPFTSLQMWLATALDGFCLMAVDADLDTELVAPQNKSACLSLLDGASLAHLTIRRAGDRAEFGAHGYDPDAEAVAGALVEAIRVWDRDHRRSEPVIYAYPVATPVAELPAGRVITKRHRRIVISWPPEGQASQSTTTEKEK
ncbi:methyltransferase, FxLD system [Streptomyces sp. H27-H1]|uniref:methyltransferase, FxLD system n=1 Tax=Streptomyces sp. H27-H1 TaxID=2996461 RepID=UPI00226DCF67|nr:methyltransferase, FxLD system [Streptomyces sp. H27-H1]MCY0932323.1 methyltransferase, FxLD system [Streptomyces sp. H27-H1]